MSTGRVAQPGLARAAADRCAEIRLRAERRAGEMLRETGTAGSGRPPGKRSGDATFSPSPKLADLGVTKDQSSRWQRIADVPEAAEIQRTLNADRRHLDEAQRRAVVVELRRDGHSERAIAGALGVSKTTVHNDIEAARLVTGDQSPEPERVIRQGGGSYPARRPTIVPAHDERQAQRAQQALQALGDDAPERTLDVRRGWSS